MKEPGHRWTPEQVDYIVGETRKGVPASVLGEALGVSRMAVLGKLSRLRAEGYVLPYRANNANRLGKGSRPPASPPPPPRKWGRETTALNGWTRSAQAVKVLSLDEPVDYPPGPRPWLTRRFGECAWPISGAGIDTVSCCAATSNPGKPYCAAHAAVAFTTPVKRERNPVPLRPSYPAQRVFGS